MRNKFQGTGKKEMIFHQRTSSISAKEEYFLFSHFFFANDRSLESLDIYPIHLFSVSAIRLRLLLSAPQETIYS